MDPNQKIDSMKKLLFVLLIACSVQGFSQQSNPVMASAAAALGDEDLNTSYQPNVNHKSLECQLMKMIVCGKDSAVMEILKTRGFSTFIVTNGENYITPTSENDILRYYNKFKALLPYTVSATPTGVKEEFIFNDRSRYEIWDYINKENRKSTLVVTFTNGQITNILITI